ncbi:uncharacterized protein C2orf78-like [Dipodomys merriami]|uniref:uncharacterized protein C2orf78-like n=1 Tax=Dipodomys merriami TaxID=94247 RepID=UPI003855712B
MQPKKDLPPVSTSRMCYSETGEPIAVIHVQGNFHNPFLPKAANALKLSLPVMSDISLTGSVYNFSRVQPPTFTSAWPLPSSLATNFHPLMGSAYLCQYSTTTILMRTQSEMVMELKDGQPTNILPPISTSVICYSASAEPTEGTSVQDFDKLIVDTTNQVKSIRTINVTPVMGENHPKNGGSKKHSGNKLKSEEKTTSTKKRHKQNQTKPYQESLKRPQSNLAMHMMESVQVFHALGKKNERKTGLLSSGAWGNKKKTKSSAENQCPSPCQSELLPPPWKVKLVPLTFLSPEKPRVRSVSHRPQSLASRRPTGADPARPPPNTAQPVPVNAAQPATDNSCLIVPIKPPWPTFSNSTLGAINHPPQSALSRRPAPYKTSSFTSLQYNPLSTTATKLSSIPKPPHQYLLQDFSLKPIPWRKSHVPGPVESDSISKEQRPERKAMKRWAKQERDKAAKNTFVGKIPFYQQRQTDMEITQYYGYAI